VVRGAFASQGDAETPANSAGAVGRRMRPPIATHVSGLNHTYPAVAPRPTLLSVVLRNP
jgi:hypothetical protein